MPKHILCADDSVTMQKVVAITFAHTDYQVLAARTADEALNLARQTRPDLVLADAVMPGKTGYDLCQAIKSDGLLRSVPVVIVCGNSQAYDEARGKQAGADGHLTKPWDTQVFVEKIGEILGRATTHGVAQASGGAVPARPAAMPAPAPSPMPAPTPAPRPTMTGTGPSALPQRAPVGPVTPTLGTKPPTPGVATRPAAAIGGTPVAGGALPKPPAGLPRPPLIRGAPVGGGRPVAPAAPALARPSAPVAVQAAHPTPAHHPAHPAPVAPAARPVAPPVISTPAPRPANPRSATIMGMPALNLPPAAGGAPPPSFSAPTQAPIPPAPAPTPVPAPPPVVARPAAPAPVPPPVSLPPPVAARPPAPAAPLPGSDALAKAAQRVAAAGMLATQQAAAAAGHDPRGVEYEAIAKLSREIIERIAWEVVPELAEVIIREHVERLKK